MATSTYSQKSFASSYKIQKPMLQRQPGTASVSKRKQLITMHMPDKVLSKPEAPDNTPVEQKEKKTVVKVKPFTKAEIATMLSSHYSKQLNQNLTIVLEAKMNDKTLEKNLDKAFFEPVDFSKIPDVKSRFKHK